MEATKEGGVAKFYYYNLILNIQISLQKWLGDKEIKQGYIVQDWAWSCINYIIDIETATRNKFECTTKAQHNLKLYGTVGSCLVESA